MGGPLIFQDLSVIENWRMLQDFFFTLRNKKEFPGQDDKLLLKESKDEHFSMKLLHKTLSQSNSTLFSYHSTWNPCVPLR